MFRSYAGISKTHHALYYKFLGVVLVKEKDWKQSSSICLPTIGSYITLWKNYLILHFGLTSYSDTILQVRKFDLILGSSASNTNFHDVMSKVHQSGLHFIGGPNLEVLAIHSKIIDKRCELLDIQNQHNILNTPKITYLLVFQSDLNCQQ